MRRLDWLLLAMLCALGVASAVQARWAASDDAYITMRIARNAIEGRGLHFNLGETGVQAATSPLVLLLYTALGWLFSLFAGAERGVELASLAVALAAYPAMAAGMYLLCRSDGGNRIFPTLAGAAAVLSPLVAYCIGLETIPLMALCLWAAWAFREERHLLLGVLCGAAFLARHDAALLTLFVIFATLLQKGSGRPNTIKVLGGLAAVVLPWLVFSALYFHETVPTTLQSKLAQGGTAYWPGPYSAQLGKWLVQEFWGQTWIAPLLAVLAAVTLYYAAFRRNREALAALLPLSYGVLHFAAYSFLNLPDYHWYFAPYGVFLLAAAGWALSRLRVPKADILGVPAAAACAFAIPQLPNGDVRREPYKEAASYLREHPPARAAGMMEIGIVAFYAPKVPIFDFSGIVTPAQIERVRSNAATAWLDDPSVADVVLIRSKRHPLEPDFDPRFANLYELEYKTSARTPDLPDGLQVFRLKR